MRRRDTDVPRAYRPREGKDAFGSRTGDASITRPVCVWPAERVVVVGRGVRWRPADGREAVRVVMLPALMRGVRGSHKTPADRPPVGLGRREGSRDLNRAGGRPAGPRRKRIVRTALPAPAGCGKVWARHSRPSVLRTAVLYRTSRVCEPPGRVLHGCGACIGCATRDCVRSHPTDGALAWDRGGRTPDFAVSRHFRDANFNVNHTRRRRWDAPAAETWPC